MGSSSNRYAPRLPQQEAKSSTKLLAPTDPILGPENLLKTGFAQKGLPSSSVCPANLHWSRRQYVSRFDRPAAEVGAMGLFVGRYLARGLSHARSPGLGGGLLSLIMSMIFSFRITHKWKSMVLHLQWQMTGSSAIHEVLNEFACFREPPRLRQLPLHLKCWVFQQGNGGWDTPSLFRGPTLCVASGYAHRPEL